jgi:hypothetical protein
MSYLNYPRLHFSGGYLADPSTINNTPNNYADSLPNADMLELYWNPNGTGVFDLQDCVVTKVVYGPDDETSDAAIDPIIGQSVKAMYTNAQPKLVDLDPYQQNSSEIWGLTVQIGGLTANPSSIGSFVRGDYIAGPFNAIWLQALNGPRSSASGAGVYQSQLKNVSWDTATSPASRFLTELKGSQGDNLSFNFVVNAHNNSPQNFIFNSANFVILNGAPYNVPVDITAKLEPMTRYFQNTGDPLGVVPTESYVNQQLGELLGQQDANTYGASIRTVTKDPTYDPGNIDTKFPCGLLTGTLGPQADDTPVYYTPSRTLAPVTRVKGVTPMCYFSPFNATEVNGETMVTINLGNGLNTNKPGFDVAMDLLGDLSLVYFDQSGGVQGTVAEAGVYPSNAVPFATLPLNMSEVMQNSAGILDIKVDASLLPAGVSVEKANQDILNMPLGLSGFTGGKANIWLAENVEGYNVRADQFSFRMNAGIPTSAAQPMGETATVNLYVTKFGQPAANVSLNISKMTEQEAFDYTSVTLGTGGTAGLENISNPQSALTISDTTISTNASGIAQFVLTGTDPFFPREGQNIDGQVYFVNYNFADTLIANSFTQDANDLVGVQVYDRTHIPTIITWDNCIQNILPQYSKLYPIMGRFKLDDYDSVYSNRMAIRAVLSKPVADALHMPVIRDLSIVRTNAVIDWIDACALKSVVIPKQV